MAEASGSDGVGGVGSAGAAGASRGSTATAASGDTADAVGSIADGMVDKATGPQGVDVAALGQALAATQGLVTPAAGQELQSAIESRLGAVDAGRLQGAIDQAAAAQDVAKTPAAEPVTPYSAVGFNQQGKPIDACGNVVAELSIDRSVPADQTDYAVAVRNLERATGGPISGPVYTGAWANGASPETLDRVHAVGQFLDGMVALQSERAEQNFAPR